MATDFANDPVSTATTTTAGQMSAADKAKTDAAALASFQALDAGIAKLALIDLSNLLLGGAAASANASLAILASKTIASAAGAVWDGIKFAASTATITGATGITTATGFNFATIQAPTISGDTAGLIIDTAATLAITGSPIAGNANTTIMAPWSLIVLAGETRFAGQYLSLGNGAYVWGVGGSPTTGNKVGMFRSWSSSQFFCYYDTSTGNTRLDAIYVGAALQFDIGGATQAAVSNAGNLLAGVTIASDAGALLSSKVRVDASKTIASAAGAVWDGIKLAASTASITGATAITTATGFNFHAIQTPTIVGDTATCAVSLAATVYIGGAPIASTNVTIAKTYSLWIDSGMPRIDSASANGSVAVVLGAIGPAGASTTVQEWLTIDINGTTRYIPCF